MAHSNASNSLDDATKKPVSYLVNGALGMANNSPFLLTVIKAGVCCTSHSALRCEDLRFFLPRDAEEDEDDDDESALMTQETALPLVIVNGGATGIEGTSSAKTIDAGEYSSPPFCLSCLKRSSLVVGAEDEEEDEDDEEDEDVAGRWVSSLSHHAVGNILSSLHE